MGSNRADTLKGGGLTRGGLPGKVKFELRPEGREKESFAYVIEECSRQGERQEQRLCALLIIYKRKLRIKEIRSFLHSKGNTRRH